MDGLYQLGLYKYKDKASSYATLPDTLKGEAMAGSCAVLQLLMGKLSVLNDDDKTIYRPRENYIELPYKRITSSGSRRDYDDYKIAFGVDTFDNETKERIDNYLRGDIRNKFIYEHVLHELTLALILMDNSPTESFVHIYRTLEFMSYTFPLIYTSKDKNYMGSFNSLKEYFNGGEGEGELKFFDKFIKTLFHDDEEIYGFMFEILLITDRLEEMKMDFQNSIPEIGKKGIHNYYLEANTLKIEFSKMQSILIEIRNKYFHMLAGKGTNNFYGMDYDINDLFRSINPYFMNWIASIYSKIFQYRLETM